MQVFRSIKDDDVVQSIRRASTRLVLVAPGVTAPVAKALMACIEGCRVGQLVIVLDADEETCRLGYCDAPSLEILSAAATKRGIAIRRQPGLRIGLLMADDEVLIWAPTPLMFEAPRGAKEPNGLILTPQTLKILPEVLGIDPEASTDKADIGTAILEPDEVANVVATIKAAPPAPFDLSRLCLVFSTKFQFIETTLRGAELTKREMRLDNLIINSDALEELRPLLHTTIQPFNTDADKSINVPLLIDGEQVYRKTGEAVVKPTTQAEMRKYWTDLLDRHVINLPGYGKIIRHTDKAKFEVGKNAFESVLKFWVKGFQDLVKDNHDHRVEQVVSLIENRMQQANEKQRLARDAIEILVRNGLDNLRVIEPSVQVVYKNITVESTRDKEFSDVLLKAIPKEDPEGWYQLFNAARMVQVTPPVK